MASMNGVDHSKVGPIERLCVGVCDGGGGFFRLFFFLDI